jgi:hypothetical protein
MVPGRYRTRHYCRGRYWRIWRWSGVAAVRWFLGIYGAARRLAGIGRVHGAIVSRFGKKLRVFGVLLAPRNRKCREQ